MKTIVTLITEGYADWEVALLNAVARGYYQVETRFASPGGAPVRSAAGLWVTPDLALEEIDAANFDALVICGGTTWQTPQAPDLGPLLRAAHEQGKVVGAICDGTVAAAKTGLLDSVAHTSSGEGYLDSTGYGGGRLYRDVPRAVSDRNVVTAGAMAPVTFMTEIMRALGLADEQLTYYAGMFAAEHAGSA